jgi:hypothetical protein
MVRGANAEEYNKKLRPGHGTPFAKASLLCKALARFNL